jgi:hypothetical protein
MPKQNIHRCFLISILDQNTGSSQHVFLWLDVRKFAAFLASDQMNPDQVTLGKHIMTFIFPTFLVSNFIKKCVSGLVQERLLHITLSLDALKFHYFIPAISL